MAYLVRGLQIYKQEDYMDIISSSKSMTSLKSVTHSTPRRLATHEEETEEMLEENERNDVPISRDSVVEVEVHTEENERDVGEERVQQSEEKEEQQIANISKPVHETSL